MIHRGEDYIKVETNLGEFEIVEPGASIIEVLLGKNKSMEISEEAAEYIYIKP